jgi:uncharacterized membrane protein (UPF0182 family)
MRDAFDEFMDELRRRRAAQESPDDAAEKGSSGESGAEPGARDDAPDGETREDEAVDTNRSGSGADGEPESGDEAPRPVFRGGGFGGGLGGRRRPRSVGPSDEFPQITISRKWIVLFIAIVVGFSLITTFFTVGIQLTTDAIWYQSIGYAGVFWTRIWSQVGLFVLGAVAAFAAIWINVWLAGRLIPKGQLRRFSLDDFLDRFNMDRYTGGGSGFGSGPFGNQPKRPGSSASASASVEVPDLSRPVFWTMLVIGILVALGLGGLLSGGWATIQLFAHQVSFQQTDPSFNKDIGFYIFQLPFYRLVQSYVNTVLLVSIVVVGIRYLVAVVSGAPLSTPSRVHLGLLAMLYLWSIAIGYQLDRFELVYSGQSTLFTGVSYADANAKFLAFNAMTVVAGFAGAFILGFAYTRWRVPLLLTFMFWISAYVVLDVAYPQLVQRFVVVPNQQAQETPYIANNISMTRLAFGLTNWNGPASQAVTYTPQATVSQADVLDEAATTQNMRLWDAGPLGQTLDGLNVIRQYYSFPDVTTDRYTFTDAASCAPAAPPCVRQVMISGRELDPTAAASSNNGSPSWVNLHITYTHGVGLVMVPVNEVVAPAGQPNLFIKDLPPTSVPGAPIISEPRIYFGTQPTVYSIVGAQSQEFDYPSQNNATGDKYNNWTGTTGIKLDSTLTRLLFAARFGDINLLISDQITNNSQLLMNRSIQERASAIAPFLRFDKEPYLVVNSQGRLDYILDGYTTSSAFPDANSFDPGSNPTTDGLAGDPFNYIRNSVKVVMDAYDGTMSFYVSDPTDPIIQAWQGVFPGVFKPMSDMPSDLKPHLRYPQDMFDAQTLQFATYHVTDPGVFYQRNDLWQVPTNSTGSGNGPTQLQLESYYVEMRVPGDANPEFVLLQPMVPNGRNNMIAWVAARMDPGSYGKISVFDFPRDANVYGPVQVESLIAQTPAISQQITLWNTNGSKVTLGNLLVIPLKNSLLYVEPVYLVASSNALPAFQKVVVTNGSTIVWGNTLQDALAQLYTAEATGPGSSPSPGGSPSPSPGASPTPSSGSTATPGASGTPQSTNVQVLISEASQHYQAAQTALANKDLATYQKEMNIVGQLLAQLAQVAGTPAPSGS